jgi:hypothetical protein
MIAVEADVHPPMVIERHVVGQHTRRDRVPFDPVVQITGLVA